MRRMIAPDLGLPDPFDYILERHMEKLADLFYEWGNSDGPCPTGAGRVLDAFDLAKHYRSATPPLNKPEERE